MESIINKAIEGGYSWWTSRYPELKETKEEISRFLHEDYEKPSWADLVCDPLFWEALAKGAELPKEYAITYGIEFHRTNLTEGWSSAVEYLEKLIK